MKVEKVDTVRCGLGEGAVWDAATKSLLFIDIWGQKVYRFDPEAGRTDHWDVPAHVGAIGLRDGGAVLAMKDSLYTLDFASGAVDRVAGPIFENPRLTINDGAVGRDGRFVFGGCDTQIRDAEPIGGLFSLGPDHVIRELDTGIHLSNGHCFAPDGRTLYCADSFTSTVYAYDYDPESGDVSNKRAFAKTTELGGLPDGSVVDSDGTVWVSVFEGGKVAAFRPDGTLQRTVALPAHLISSVAIGGPALDTLYVTTIDPAAFGGEPDDAGGHVYAVTGLGIRGVPEASYAG